MPYIVNFYRVGGIQKIYFNAVETPVSAPTDIWVSTWYPTDETVTLPSNLAAEGYGDVNKYTYVKPMLHIFDCTDPNSFETSTATEFINGTNCGIPNTRINALIDKLKQLPEGKRTYRTTRYDRATLYNHVNDRFANGEQSPWAENVGISLSNDIATLFGRFGICGATPDYIAIDSEQRQLAFQYQPLTNHSGTTLDILQLYGITSDVKYNQTWYGLSAFADLYKNDITGQTYTFDNIVSGTYHPQNQRQYLYYNRAMTGLLSALIDKFISDPIKAVFPSVKVSNYKCSIITDGGTFGNAYDHNGHPEMHVKLVGDGASPEMYAGWGFPNSYGIYEADPTRIVRTDYAGSGITAFPGSSWNHFLILMQNMRTAVRDNPNTPIRPWVSSPYFTAWGANWTTNSENLGLYYESIRHMALMNTEVFLYFNSDENTSGRLTTALPKLNSVIQEVNTIKGGYQPNKCVTIDRINFLTDYILTGAGTTRGTYLWRVTPKPDFNLETIDERYPIELDSDGGAWIETATSTPPGLTLAFESRFLKARQNDLLRRYYSYIFVAAETGIHNPANLIFDGWSYSAKSTFMGIPSGGKNFGSVLRTTRAYPFEYDPVNPKTSSPWHNIIYEHFFQDYNAGVRALSIHFPWATAFSKPTGMNSWLLQPLDQLYGTTGFTFMYPRAGLCGYTNGYKSTTEPEWCQARIKGFTGAIKQLLEGTMTPTGRSAISEACDVVIYTPSLDGWPNYRTQKNRWWDYSAGTSAERDAALNARIDQYINEFIIPMKATTATGGILSICLDVGSYCANPDDIHLWRTLPDYRSDACELASWTLMDKLRDNGVYVYTEARGVTQNNRINLGFTYPDNILKQGSIGATAPTHVSSIVGDEHFFWFSDPELSLIGSFGDTYFRNTSHIPNRNIPVVTRLTGSYLTHGQRTPWKFSTETTYAGYTMEQFFANFSDPAGPHYAYSMVYSPYYSISQLYSGADIYQDYLYRTATYGNEIWGERRALKQFSTLALAWFNIGGWPQINIGYTYLNSYAIPQIQISPGSTLDHDYTWWSPIDVPSTVIMPLFDGFGFTTSADTKTVYGYPTTNYNGGFWTQTAVDWWQANVRGRTFGTLLNIFKELATQANITGAPNPPYWLGAGPEPSPYDILGKDDQYWTNGVDASIR